MAYSKAERYTLPMAQDSVHIPAVELEYNTIGYNHEVEVTLFLDIDGIDSVTFTGYINSGNRLTIPVTIRNRFDLGDEVTISVEATGDRWEPSVGASARKAVYESAHPEEQNLEAVTDIVADD